MRIQRGYQFRLDPTSEVEVLLVCFAGHSHYVCNQALALNLWRVAHGVGLYRGTPISLVS